MLTFAEFKAEHPWRAVVADKEIGYFSQPDAAMNTARHEAREFREKCQVRPVPYGVINQRTGEYFDERKLAGLKPVAEKHLP